MTATDFLLTDAGDVALNSNNTDFVYVSDLDAIAQGCMTRLRLLRGEWLLNTGAGFDFDRVTGAGITDQGIESEVRRVLGNVKGVATVVSVAVARSDRLVRIDFEATGTLGDLITGSVEA